MNGKKHVQYLMGCHTNDLVTPYGGPRKRIAPATRVSHEYCYGKQLPVVTIRLMDTKAARFRYSSCVYEELDNKKLGKFVVLKGVLQCRIFSR